MLPEQPLFQVAPAPGRRGAVCPNRPPARMSRRSACHAPAPRRADKRASLMASRAAAAAGSRQTVPITGASAIARCCWQAAIRGRSGLCPGANAEVPTEARGRRLSRLRRPAGGRGQPHVRRPRPRVGPRVPDRRQDVPGRQPVAARTPQRILAAGAFAAVVRRGGRCIDAARRNLDGQALRPPLARPEAGIARSVACDKAAVVRMPVDPRRAFGTAARAGPPASCEEPRRRSVAAPARPRRAGCRTARHGLPSARPAGADAAVPCGCRARPAVDEAGAQRCRRPQAPAAASSRSRPGAPLMSRPGRPSVPRRPPRSALGASAGAQATAGRRGTGPPDQAGPGRPAGAARVGARPDAHDGTPGGHARGGHAPGGHPRAGSRRTGSSAWGGCAPPPRTAGARPAPRPAAPPAARGARGRPAGRVAFDRRRDARRPPPTRGRTPRNRAGHRVDGSATAAARGMRHGAPPPLPQGCRSGAPTIPATC